LSPINWRMPQDPNVTIIIDLFTRECLGIEVGLSLRAEHVVAAMDWLKYDRGYRNGSPATNGSEFSGGQMDLWAYTHQVQMDFTARGKPTDNARWSLQRKVPRRVSERSLVRINR